jgi:hypothetical protein
MRQIMFALALALCSVGVAQAQEAVTIEDASWLVGRWEGEGFGGQLEEVWSAPVGNQMVGHFRMIQNGQPAFYEFLLIEEHEGTLRYRVKHFNPDFVGWEEKDGFHEFGWVSATDGELAFDGLVIRRISDDVSDHIIRTRAPDGSVREQVLRYRRVGG